jgi:threonine/homoserine/homoserine lactone efflux protein
VKSFSKIFFWGALISFVGSLPPGTMNIVATQITAQQGYRAGTLYSIGSMLAEVIIVRLALGGMKRLMSCRQIFHFLDIVTAILLLLMTIGCFVAAVQMNDFVHILPKSSWHPFWVGLFISAVNPLHLPFWLGWTTLMMNKGIVTPQAKSLNVYVLGISFGTMLGFLTFIYGGYYLMTVFRDRQFEICIAAGSVLLVITYLHIRRMVVAMVKN